MRELQAGLAVEIGWLFGRPLNPLNISPPESIVQSCGGLIDHEENSGLVTFLEEHSDEILLPPFEICLTLLTYLQDLSFFTTSRSLFIMYKLYARSESQLASYALNAYAVDFWASHSRTLKESSREVAVEQATLKIFMDPLRRKAVGQFGDTITYSLPFLHFMIAN